MKFIEIVITYEAIDQAIRATKRVGAKPSLLLKRYHCALSLAIRYNEALWHANPKRKRYEKKIRYYKKLIGV